jgi:hypothetical protein
MKRRESARKPANDGSETGCGKPSVAADLVRRAQELELGLNRSRDSGERTWVKGLGRHFLIDRQGRR